MISIVICSRDQKELNSVSENVELTIGLPYEIVAIDNSKGAYSIFEAYNIGIQESRYDILCFMHEDVSFETDKWGEKVVQAFRHNSQLGLLGVAGSSYKPAVPSGWSFDAASQKTFYVNIIQHSKSTGSYRKVCLNPRNEIVSKVASIDGVWFCTTRAVVDQIKFDVATFNSFHCYDVDFSLSVLQKYEVAVTFEVLINHYSEGSFNDSWTSETIKLHNKWRNALPINLDNISAEQQAQEEFNAFYSLLPKLEGKRNLSLAVLKSLWKNKILKLVGPRRFALMNLVLLKKSIE